MPTDTTTDLETVRALQASTAAYIKALQKARPAARRLEKAGYPAAEVLLEGIEEALDTSCGPGVPPAIHEDIDALLVTGADRVAWDFYSQVVRYGKSLVEAEIELRACGGDKDDRVAAMLAYAATQKLSAEARLRATPIQQIELDRWKLGVLVANGSDSEARKLAWDLRSRILELYDDAEAALAELRMLPTGYMEARYYPVAHSVDVLSCASRVVNAVLKPAEAATA
jgi:hypothetical protein